jgi:hypothetical protein
VSLQRLLVLNEKGIDGTLTPCWSTPIIMSCGAVNVAKPGSPCKWSACSTEKLYLCPIHCSEAHTMRRPCPPHRWKRLSRKSGGGFVTRVIRGAAWRSRGKLNPKGELSPRDKDKNNNAVVSAQAMSRSFSVYGCNSE